MTRTAHKLFISILVAIVFITIIVLIYNGLSYYRTSVEERFYHHDNNLLKPSGVLGHGFGIVGSFLIVVGVTSYMARKRYRFLSRLGVLKHWLEFHIFLCTLGPILVLFHTAYKFGGLVAISFWSMVAVFLSGIAGRFIYLQIPRSIEGNELSLNDIKELRTDVAGILKNSYNLDEDSFNIITDSINKKVELYHPNALFRFFRKYFKDQKTFRIVKEVLRKNNMSKTEMKKVLDLVRDDIKLNRKIERLSTMQNMFKYWHVIHSPFALVMLIIMVIHVGVTIVFGYRWIF
jgi:sulfur relay (sulfurtransferase) DsrC/TusE family protein